jgi:hypothetical protein
MSYLDPYIEYAARYIDFPYLYWFGNIALAAFFSIAGVAKLISRSREVRSDGQAEVQAVRQRG